MERADPALSYASSVEFLEGLYREPHVPAARAGLERAAVLLQRLGNPHRSFRSVHIAGTTGKGSTTSMIGSVLVAAGYRTGFFRSPHLSSYRERIAIDDEVISEESWLWAFGLVRPLVDVMRANQLPGYSLGRPTLFEVLFAMACLHFAREGVEWGAVETGVGGRLDPTNLLESDVAVVTNVSLEHTQILGATVSEIAREKAAIIKHEAHAVTGATAPEALDVIESRARDVGSPLAVLGRDIAVEITDSDGSSQRIVLKSGSEGLALRLPLAGPYQAGNAGLAYGALLALRERHYSVTDEAIRRGLERARVPGRLEIFPGKPEVILDGAHNPAGMRALAEALSNQSSSPTSLLFAAMGDKDIEAMAAVIAPLVDKVVVTHVPGTSRSGTVQRIEQAFARAGKTAACVDDARDAFCRAHQVTPPEGRVIVAGSIYLVGEIRSLLAEARP